MADSEVYVSLRGPPAAAYNDYYNLLHMWYAEAIRSTTLHSEAELHAVGTTITIRLNTETLEFKTMIKALGKSSGMYQNRSESAIVLMLLEKPLRDEFKKLSAKRKQPVKE